MTEMTDDAAKAAADAPAAAPLDEARLARLLALGLPVATIVIAAVVGAMTGLATALLVLIGGALLGVIAIFWASLRVLSGEAPLPPELEDLDLSAQGADALASRRKMLVRALKDLENERDLGKLEAADFEQVAGSYREELKDVLRRMDATLEPHREKAEELARAHLEKAGLGTAPAAGEKDAEDEEDAERAETDAAAKERREEPPAKTTEKTERKRCPKCKASNEPDAKFCKECATSLREEKVEAVDEA